jgi:hypothetical protein
VESEKDATNANQEGLHHLAEFLYQEADVGMEHLVDLAADAAQVAGVWVRAKHLLGRGFTKLGMWLSADMRAAQARRLERTRGALAHLQAVRLAGVAGRP